MNRTRLAICHPDPLQNIKGMLPLVKKKTRLVRLNSDTQEVVKRTEILHRKLLLQRGDNALKQLWTGGCQDNVISLFHFKDPWENKKNGPVEVA
jgi:hypothetical protein